MKRYFLFVLLVSSMLFMVGWVGPAAISSGSTEIAVLGALSLVLCFPGWVWLIKEISK